MDQGAAHLEHTDAFCSGSEDHCKQFCVRKRFRTESRTFFIRTFLLRKVLHLYGAVFMKIHTHNLRALSSIFYMIQFYYSRTHTGLKNLFGNLQTVNRRAGDASRIAGSFSARIQVSVPGGLIILFSQDPDR